MDESSFDIDSKQVAEGCARFPAHRLAPREAGPVADLHELATASDGEFGRHAWDEAGHL